MIACSSDDDRPKPEPIDRVAKTLGKWKLTDRIPNGVEFCELKTTIEFKEENNLHAVAYAGDEPGDCDFFEVDGSWEYVAGTNKMKIKINGGETTYFWISFDDDFKRINLTNTETEVTEIYGKVN